MKNLFKIIMFVTSLYTGSSYASSIDLGGSSIFTAPDCALLIVQHDDVIYTAGSSEIDTNCSSARVRRFVRSEINPNLYVTTPFEDETFPKQVQIELINSDSLIFHFLPKKKEEKVLSALYGRKILSCEE